MNRYLIDRLISESIKLDGVIYCSISDLYIFLKEAITIGSLYQGTKDYMRLQPASQDREFRGAVMRTQGYIKDIYVIPFWGTKMLDFEAKVGSETTRDVYSVKIQFYGMDLSENFSKKTPVKWVSKKGEEFYSSLINPNTRIGVHCSCNDFRFTFSWWLKNKGSLVGRHKSYQRKTTWWKPRNIAKVVGGCKHIFSVLTALEQVGIYTTNRSSNREINSTDMLKLRKR